MREGSALLPDATASARKRRARARDVYSALGFELVFEDGTVEAEEGHFSQTIEFSDISYQSASEEQQRAWMDVYSQIFEFGTPDMSFQVLLTNTEVPEPESGSVEFFATDDPLLRPYAEDYNRVLNAKLRDGVVNLKRDRYITFAVGAASYAEALPKLTPIRNTVTEKLGKLECETHRLDGVERAELIGAWTRPGLRTAVDYSELGASGLTVKDFLCPPSIDKRPGGDSSAFALGRKLCRVLVIYKLGSALSDACIKSLVDLPLPMCVSLHVQPLSPSDSQDFVASRLSFIDKDIVDKQQHARQKGYSSWLIPQELAYSRDEAERLLELMKKNGQLLFEWTGCVMTYADTPEELDERCLAIMRAARTEGMEVDVLTSQPLQGLNSVLPLASNHLGYKRNVITASVATMIPFATMELSHEGGGYYGQNRISDNLILLSRRSMSAPMGFLLGMPGSGKSFYAKQEITNTVLAYPGDEVIIIDPKNEYSVLTEALGGVAYFLPEHNINLLDVYAGTQEVTGVSPASFKTDTLIAIAAQVMGLEKELPGSMKTIVDRCVKKVFERFEGSPFTPQLGDFYDVLCEQPEPDAAELRLAFEIYVEGGLSFVNRPTSFPGSRRVTSFSFKGLGEDMKVFMMLVILDWTYNRMLYNFERGVRTWLYVDEVQSLFSCDAVMRYFDKFWSEGRSYGLIPTGITQTVERVLCHETGRMLIRNSGFLALLRQSDIDRANLAALLNLSSQLEDAIKMGIPDGSGLLIAGNARIAFKGGFPPGPLYDLFNTKPDEVLERKAAEWDRRAAAGIGRDGAE